VHKTDRNILHSKQTHCFRDVRFSQRCWWRCTFFGIWRNVDW